MRHAVLVGEGLCGLNPRVYEGHDLDFGRGSEGLKVSAADSAAAHQSDPGGAARVVTRGGIQRGPQESSALGGEPMNAYLAS